MERDYTELMSNKSDEEIQVYIDNRIKYNPNAVFAAIEELKKRGRILSDDEIEEIRMDLERKKAHNIKLIEESGEGFSNWSKNVVADMDAPEFYSERTIYTFSILFSVLFGSILMAINLSKTEKKNGVVLVVLFGLTYTILQVVGLSYIPRNSGLTFIVSMGGALILNYFFWRYYIGKETKYKAKPIWIPLIIALVITLPIIYFTFFYVE